MMYESECQTVDKKIEQRTSVAVIRMFRMLRMMNGVTKMEKAK